MMSIGARREYARAIGARYHSAGRRERSTILDEFVRTCGYNRKYAIWLLRHPPGARRTGTKRTRAKRYGEDVQRALERVWKASDRLCGKRLAPFLGELVPTLERHQELDLAPATRARLLCVSAATADRLLAPVRRRLGWRGRTTTKPGTLLRNQIEVRTANGWEQDTPGYFEADLVAHCGESTHGEYLHSLVLTDVATGWTEPEAVLNRSQMNVTAAIDRIRKRLPFPVLGIDSDNGSEFINANLHRYCKQHQIAFTRCRPYKKNDQCRVEQKNWSVVRQRIGYRRYEGAIECQQLARVYSWLRPFVNYLQPSMKLVTKRREGARVIKRHDQASTPYKRLLDYRILTGEQREDIDEYYLTLNPVRHIQEIHAAYERLEHAAKVRIAGEATKAA